MRQINFPFTIALFPVQTAPWLPWGGWQGLGQAPGSRGLSVVWGSFWGSAIPPLPACRWAGPAVAMSSLQFQLISMELEVNF